MFKDRYEFRVDWSRVTSDASMNTMALLAGMTGNPLMMSFIISRCMAKFIYDLQNNEYLSEEDGFHLMSQMVDAGEECVIMDAIEEIAQGVNEGFNDDFSKESPGSEDDADIDLDELRRVYGLD